MALSLTTFHTSSLPGPATKRASPGQLRRDLHYCADRKELLLEDSLSLLVPGEMQLKKGRMKVAGYRRVSSSPCQLPQIVPTSL